MNTMQRTLLALCTALTGACAEAGRPDAAATADSAATVPSASAPAAPAMAITLDDLPWIGAVGPGETRADALRRLADTLATRRVPAIGFANCARAGSGGALLRPWQDAGLELGNHTAAHLDLNEAPLERWLRDVRSCDEMIRSLTGDTTIWFRYPFLHQGPTAERQSAALDLLRELHSPVAHVSIDNSDWILAVAYGAAVSGGDSARAAAIGAAFVDHILSATEHYQQVAREKLGRDVAHVLLLHANLLVTDHVGRLLDRLRDERGFSFVSVSAAQQDAAYQRPDEYTGEHGLSWLYRMAPATPEMKAWDDAEASRLRARWRQDS